MANSNVSDNYILINYKALAEKLVEVQFHEEYEQQLPWEELYEQVDESGNWYLRQDYQLIFNSMLYEMEEFLREHDITNSLSI